MTNVVRVAKRIVPVEQIVLFEPFVAPADSPLRTTKEFKSRIVLLDKTSFLTEEKPEALAAEHGFRMLPEDSIATNPIVPFRVELFEPAEGFRPARPYRSRILWKDRLGTEQSRLLLATPEVVLAIVVRGEVRAVAQTGDGPRRNERRRRAAARPRDPA